MVTRLMLRHAEEVWISRLNWGSLNHSCILSPFPPPTPPLTHAGNANNSFLTGIPSLHTVLHLALGTLVWREDMNECMELNLKILALIIYPLLIVHTITMILRGKTI